MEAATVEPRNDPMHKQNEREDPQRERRLLAARPHAFAQEVRIERRERNEHDDGENCEIRPKARDGEQAPGGSFIKYWLIHFVAEKRAPSRVMGFGAADCGR